MSINFSDFTTLNTYVLLASYKINLTDANGVPSSITTNTSPANYAARLGFTGSGTIVGGILNDANKTTALSELNTLCTNLDTVIATGPTTALPTISDPGSITVTPGIYIIPSPFPGGFNFQTNQTIICDGAGTYIFTTSSNEGMNLYGTITLINGAVITDIYWYLTVEGGMTIGSTNMKGIFIQNAIGPISFDYNSIIGYTVLNGCVYNNSNNINSNILISSTTFNSETLCYLRNTLILTDTGYKPIQDLYVGDLVLSYGPISDSRIISHSQPLFTPITWIQSFKPSFRNRSTMPIHFQKDSLGPNVPRKDLWLSPFHGIFVDGKMNQAQHFINGTTITQDFDLEEVEYFHFETKEHCVVDAGGVKSETFINVNYAIRNLSSLNDPKIKMESTTIMECM
jgi:hypothetical protein